VVAAHHTEGSALAQAVVWKPIAGFDGYDISSDGQVRSWRVPGWSDRRRASPRLIVAGPHHISGRLKVRLRADDGRGMVGLYIHQLVALAFIGAVPQGMEVCHNDGDHLNNRVENLRYDTHQANMYDRVLHGTDWRGSNHPKSKLLERDVHVIRSLRNVTSSIQLADLFGVSSRTISAIWTGRIWSHLPHSKPKPGEVQFCPVCKGKAIDVVINCEGRVATGNYLCGDGHAWLTKWLQQEVA
jgi:hypothetical protein